VLCEDLLRILEAFDHLLIVALEYGGEGITDSLAALVNKDHELILVADQDLGLVIEVDLDDLVAQLEENAVLRLDPLLQVNKVMLAARLLRRRSLLFVVL